MTLSVSEPTLVTTATTVMDHSGKGLSSPRSTTNYISASKNLERMLLLDLGEHCGIFWVYHSMGKFTGMRMLLDREEKNQPCASKCSVQLSLTPCYDL